MVSFEERFKELKEQKGVKNRDIAELLEISMRAVQFYDTGDRKPDFYGLIKLADFFNVSLDYLVGRTNNPKSHLESESNETTDLSNEKGTVQKNVREFME